MTSIETQLEKWESNTQATIYVNKFDPARPGAFVQERVRPGRSFLITSEERKLLNSDRVIEEKNDPFKNGMLRPVKGDAVKMAREEEQKIQQRANETAAPNPNHMSDEELGALFNIRNFKRFEKAVGEITSQAVLNRLLILSEDEQYSATVSMVRVIEGMLDSAGVEDGPEVVEVEQNFRVGASEEVDRSGLQQMKI
jgi:hypothetical protein